MRLIPPRRRRTPFDGPRATTGDLVIDRLKTSRTTLTVAAIALGLTLSACSPVTTNRPYAASDGVRGQVGDLTVDNLMILTAAEGAPGILLGAVTNTGSTADEVRLSSATGAVTITGPVAGQSTVNFFTNEPQVLIPEVPAAPGQVLALTLSNSAGETTTVSVPVLDGTLPEYTDYVPLGDTAS